MHKMQGWVCAGLGNHPKFALGICGRFSPRARLGGGKRGDGERTPCRASESPPSSSQTPPPHRDPLSPAPDAGWALGRGAEGHFPASGEALCTSQHLNPRFAGAKKTTGQDTLGTYPKIHHFGPLAPRWGWAGGGGRRPTGRPAGTGLGAKKRRPPLCFPVAGLASGPLWSLLPRFIARGVQL